EPAEAPVSAFSTNAYRNATLVVPDGSGDSYKAHPTWSNFLEIRENSDIPTKIEVVDGAIVVKGSDNVRVYNASGAQVYSGAAGRIELPAGIYLVATDSVSKKVRL
ncbi:MAG: T9SS type A sorting domain-containing protein, partial [Bacteroides sp.]|nr:T9SS type A sorting domain-containing protein [Bacteroides sp.]